MLPTRLLLLMAICAALFGAGEAQAAPMKVVGRFLQDAHGNNIMMRGVNVPVYKSGAADDLDAVSAAIARTKTNTVRLEWWAAPPAGSLYSLENLDRAIAKFRSLGIISVVELHDRTFKYLHEDTDGNDRVLFANTITAFWTRPEVVALLEKHRDYVVINVANEWGSSFYGDQVTPTTANFIQNYADAIGAMRNAGITAPVMVDAPKGFEYQFFLDHGAAVLATDPQHNMLLSIHAYWAPPGPQNPGGLSDAAVNAVLDAFMASGLPVVLGEVSSNAWTTIQCDPVNYANLLTRANTNAIGYLFWAWYEDGNCGQSMNMTVGFLGDGVTITAAPSYGDDAIHHPGFGIDAAQPPTVKADFSPVGAPALLQTSFAYDVTSTADGVTRAATAQVTRLDNFGTERRPVVVFMPGWGGVGDVAAARDEQAVMFANHGYVALSIGFHQTRAGDWNSDLPESAKAALDALCLQAYADCGAVVLTGESYGGTQTHPVVRFLRAAGTFDGSGGANAGRKVIGILGQDSGYTLHWAAPADADATAYSIAMIQNLGDAEFPVDSCEWSNCGARNRADFHKVAAGSQYVLSFCPAGGSHGVHTYASWDAWVLSAVKTMLHSQRNVPRFTGYVEPTLAVSNACVTASPTTAAASLSPASLDFGAQSMGTTTPAQVVTVTNVGTGILAIDAVTVSEQFAQTNNCVSLAQGAACTINVTLTPSSVAGVINSTTSVRGTLSVASNGTGSPNTITLSGSGEKSLVTHYYRSILRRAPDGAGKAYWQAEALRMQSGGANVNETWYALAVTFFFSSEFASLQRDNAGFVADLYATFFNRQPDGGGLSYWSGLLAGGMPREVVLASFLFSPEFTAFTQAIFGNTAARAEVDVVMDFYRGVLGRLPDDGGLAYWVQKFRAAQCQGAASVYEQANSISGQFVSGPEYAGRNRANGQFVGDMYNAFLRRGGDRAGVQFWIDQLNGGMTREAVRQAFFGSPEFGSRVQALVQQGCLQGSTAR